MANEEGIKIPIIAEDRFTETIKKIDAYTKIFGETASNTEKKLAALEKEMVRLVANGMDPANKKIIEMKANYDKLSQSLNTGGGSVKESNKKWNALSLIVQDLPFGFRAIQNNLPALVGSFAAAGGAIYLAFSVAIAIATSFEKEIASLFSTVTQAERMQKTYNASIEAGQKAYADAKLQVMQLNDQVKEAAGNKDKEKKAVDDYNDTIGKTLGHLKTFKEVQQSLIDQGDAYVNYIFKINMANAAAAKVAEESANMMIAAFKDPSKFIGTWDKVFSAQINIFGDMTAAAIGTAEELAKRGKENQQAAIKDAGLNAVAAEEVYKTFKKQVEEAKKGLKFGSFADPKDAQRLIKQQQIVNEQVIQNLIDAKKQEVKMVEDDAFAKYEVSKQLIELEKRLALEKLNNAGYTAKQITALEIGIYKERDNKLVLLGEAFQVQLLEQSKKLSEKKKKEKENELKESVYFAKKQANQIETQLGVEDKLNKGSLNKRIEYAKQAMAKLAILAAMSFNPASAQVYLEMFDKINAKVLGLGSTLKEFNKSLTTIINNTLTELGTALGEGLGNIFAEKGGLTEMLSSFVTILADGLISIGKLAIQTGVTLLGLEAALKTLGGAGAIAVGIAAVALGTFVKAKVQKTTKFANGGIVSGPTMGLMGEYPGASSNPEVVAPLDKLKDMIGGSGGGTFVLRGQDLLLSVNRAQKASNIKGQTISLA
jgi:hypothetical protein